MEKLRGARISFHLFSFLFPAQAFYICYFKVYYCLLKKNYSFFVFILKKGYNIHYFILLFNFIYLFYFFILAFKNLSYKNIFTHLFISRLINSFNYCAGFFFLF